MSTGSITWNDQTIQIGDATLHLRTGGSGAPLLVLHDEMGRTEPLNYATALAQDFSLHMPGLPGFGVTDRLDWVMSVRDLASWYLRVLEEMGLDRVNVLGFSLGGWLAAEMASQSPKSFNKMALVAPTGIKPESGEIFDMFLVIAREYIDESFLDINTTPEYATAFPLEPTPEQIELWEMAREESARLSWRPYMYHAALPHLLGRVKDLPTLLVWGDQDAVVPLSAAEQYQQAIQGSKLEIIANSGHHPEMEQTDRFVGLIKDFFA
ncbi:MAG: hypothetical protein CL902_01495 [Dehalococcoidia bacterium]|nr:hypothetical protein [Dehalococcoidia bacterium]|tara:strand:+ start:258 stop:1055 length:798 start_codon:yes stop_codon:yes gene_type:complete